MKLVYLLWRSGDRDSTTSILIEKCAPAILDSGAGKLVVYAADRESEMRSPAPKLYTGPPICGSVHVWQENVSAEVEEILASGGFEIAGYEVDESVYKDYGDNEHSGVRDWPDGVRSPGVVAVTLMQRPRRLSREEWIRRWHDRMSPVSEEIQPRARYVRNLVLRPVTPDAPPFEGIVEETWPSKRHVSSPYLFYGAKNPIQLAVNMGRILGAVLSFLDLRRIRTTMMGEYFIKT
ncbi:MAG: EthD domain-containing protein [Deltaproteobacteria bacterium]|nr:EthD domain-containing protein [Deltaproteobacteria bacterium]